MDIFVLSVFMLMAGAAISLVAQTIGVIWVLSGLVGTGYSCYCLWGPPQPAIRGGRDSAPRNRAKGEAPRQPFRWDRVGWVLKIGGGLYWLMMATALADGISEFFAKFDLGPNGELLKTGIWRVLWAPSALLIYLGYRICQKPFSASKDRRKSILFLPRSLTTLECRCERMSEYPCNRADCFHRGQVSEVRKTALI